MIEAYAFFAAFLVQILAVSVVYPAWFISYVRVRAMTIPTERLAELYPGVDLVLGRERFLTRYRAANTGIAVLGLLLFGWLFSLMRGPDWRPGAVQALVTAYFMVQMSPVALIGWLGVKHIKLLKRSLPETKRTAILQRRGLFDFVSPFVVVLAVLAYFLFVAFVLYIRQHPFPGFAGLINIGAITLVYALNAFVVYKTLYGRKSPFDTHEARAHTMGTTVKILIYSCIAVVVFLSLDFTLRLLELKTWEPFALSIFFVITSLLSLTGLTAPPRKPDVGAKSASLSLRS